MKKLFLIFGFLYVSSALQIVDDLVNYWNKLPSRDVSNIDLIVVHHTADCDYAATQVAINTPRYGDGTGNSGHYTVDRNGTVWRNVPQDHEAYHVVNFNGRSIGIEQVNIGRLPYGADTRMQQCLEPFEDPLVHALIELINKLKTDLPNIKFIAGHSDLDIKWFPSSDDPECSFVRNKIDPGPLFPWNKVLPAVQLQRYQPYEPKAPLQAVQVIDNFVSYVDKLPKRDTSTIDLIVVHFTEECDLDHARQTMNTVVYSDGTGNSGHYIIDRDGTVYRYVPEDREAWHVINYNGRSIGIETVNMGRYPDYFDSRVQLTIEPYLEPIIDNLVALINQLKTQFPSIKYISGHNDLDVTYINSTDDPGCTKVRTKVDPGPMFPWEKVVKAVGLQRYQPNGVVSLNPVDHCTTPPPPTCSCNQGWYASTTSTCKCYIFASGIDSWYTALNDCKVSKSNLASIDSAFENSNLVATIKSWSPTCTKLYTGLEFDEISQGWIWVNGDKSTYRNWRAGSPSSNPDTKCAVLNLSDGKWTDELCHEASYCYICAKN
uniref:N-acetylmuramoyl-L-alanine amidase n=1 Tax=Acrobeloides nanus TaxID=290746 RepID=A0A914E0H5_9BILA